MKFIEKLFIQFQMTCLEYKHCDSDDSKLNVYLLRLLGINNEDFENTPEFWFSILRNQEDTDAIQFAKNLCNITQQILSMTMPTKRYPKRNFEKFIQLIRNK